MRNVAFYFLFALSIGAANAQSNFHSRVSFDTVPYGWASGVGYADSSFHFWGSYIRTTPMWETGKLFVGKCNVNGNFAAIAPFQFLAEDTVYQASQPQPLVYIDKNIYLAGYKNDTSNNYGGVVYKYNTETGALLKAVYDSDMVEGYDYITYDGRNGLYTMGITADSAFTFGNLLISKYDTALNKVWDFVWETGKQNIYAGGIRLTSDSCVILSFAEGLNFTFRIHVMKVNKYGQLIFEEQLSGLGSGLCRMFDYNQTDGSTIFLSGQTGTESPVYYISKLDSSLNILWSRTYQNYVGGSILSSVWNGMRVKDGYVFVGTRSSSTKGWVHKLDFNGNKVWEATYTGVPTGTLPAFSYMYISGIDTLPNGGYVLSGSTDSVGNVLQGESWQVAFVMTIDSNGCFSNTTCEATYFTDIEYFEPAIAVNVYPNPAAEQINFTFTNLQLNQCQLQISNALGQLVSQSEIRNSQSAINIGTWPSGIYFWALQQEGRTVRSGKFVKE
jgi:hypothetical protein